MLTGTAGQIGPPRMVLWAWVLSEEDTIKAKGERKSARRNMVKPVVKMLAEYAAEPASLYVSSFTHTSRLAAFSGIIDPVFGGSQKG